MIDGWVLTFVLMCIFYVPICTQGLIPVLIYGIESGVPPSVKWPDDIIAHPVMFLILGAPLVFVGYKALTSK